MGFEGPTSNFLMVINVLGWGGNEDDELRESACSLHLGHPRGLST